MLIEYSKLQIFSKWEDLNRFGQIFFHSTVLHKMEIQEDQNYFKSDTNIGQIWECKKWERDQKHKKSFVLWNWTIQMDSKKNPML